MRFILYGKRRDKPTGNQQTSDCIPTAPTESQSLMQDTGLLEEAVWEQGKVVCVSHSRMLRRGQQLRSVETEQPVREATSQTCAPQSPQSPQIQGSTQPLAVSGSLEERKWEGRETETELAGVARGLQFITTPTDSSNWPVRSVLH